MPVSAAAEPVPSEGAAPPEGRRARQRRELLAEIEATARRLLDEGGAANVSMRAIAREVGLGPASLYTYFDSLDDVLTMLLLSSYARLASATAAAVDAFAGEPPADRALVGILAYRRWALDHTNEFNLIFTDQLPGYAAPPDGPTIDAQVEVFRPITEMIDGHTDPGNGLSDDEARALVWSSFHGAVMLEVNHHLVWLDDLGAFFETAVRRAFTAVGLPAPTAEVRRRFDRWASAVAH